MWPVYDLMYPILAFLVASFIAGVVYLRFLLKNRKDIENQNNQNRFSSFQK